MTEADVLTVWRLQEKGYKAQEISQSFGYPYKKVAGILDGRTCKPALETEERHRCKKCGGLNINVVCVPCNIKEYLSDGRSNP